MEEFEMLRLNTPLAQGRPQYWRWYPNEEQIEVFPTPEADATGDEIEFLYTAPPDIDVGLDTDIEEVRFVDLPTVVAGLRYYAFEEMLDPTDAPQLNASRFQAAHVDWESRLSEERRKSVIRLYTGRERILSLTDKALGENTGQQT